MKNEIRLSQIARAIKEKRAEIHKLNNNIRGLRLYGNLLRLGLDDEAAQKLIGKVEKQTK